MPVTKDPKTNAWYIRTYIKDENGKSKQITRRNKNEWVGRDGYNLAHQEEVRLKSGKYGASIDVDMQKKEPENAQVTSLLGEVIEKYQQEIEKYDKESTLYSYNSIINTNILGFFQRDVPTTKITKEDILQWHDYLNSKKYSIKYKRKCHTIMLSILDTGIEFFDLKENVASMIGNFKKSREDREKVVQENEKIKYITFEQFQTFISVVDEELWYVYFNLLYFTGMRKGEVQALTWNDIDFLHKKIKVNKTLTVKTYESTWKITSTKNLKNRVIDIDENLNIILCQYYLKKSSKKNFSMNNFVLGDIEPLKQHKIDYTKEKYFRISGIPEITNHEFRHSHVSLMINEYLKAGETDTTKFFIMMSNRMGHTIKVMQETYLHLFPDTQTPIVNLIDTLLSKQDQKQDQDCFGQQKSLEVQG